MIIFYSQHARQHAMQYARHLIHAKKLKAENVKRYEGGTVTTLRGAALDAFNLFTVRLDSLKTKQLDFIQAADVTVLDTICEDTPHIERLAGTLQLFFKHKNKNT